MAAQENPVCCSGCHLDELEPGCSGRVLRFTCGHHLRRRLMALGVCPSAEVCVLGRAIGRGPLVVRAGTVRLMLRPEEAAGVEVETLEREPRDLVAAAAATARAAPARS